MMSNEVVTSNNSHAT